MVDGVVDGKPEVAESEKGLKNVDTDITNIAGTSRMTRSGRIYTPNFDVNPQEPTRGAANINPTPERGGAQPAVQTDEAKVKDPVEKTSLSFASLKSAKSAVEGGGPAGWGQVINVNEKNDRFGLGCIDEGYRLSGHGGSPSPCCEIKLVDVPEMNYTSDDQPNPCGEFCIRGPIIFQGYYKDEVQTREVIDEEGWLHTGDIGIWIVGGRLKIIDRKKNNFKMAQGGYIAPEKIENVYVKCNFVAQCFIYGDSFNSSLVAVVSVDPDVMKAWAASQGIVHKDLTQLCNNPKQAPFVHLQQTIINITTVQQPTAAKC
ncbi:long chain acyl-CoA synthetase 6, peroxisomal-like [Lathyrus oleraceus]|uniref:long chain acyl-CoA synthetase 6, peroxisomal-like n=1 Tax=Pisum sativum TaxID=3888 RepID=UPI0021D1BD2F|nr:long chain acyl-CoA synthetase 6, peroxisomal-like [Pisum sativum]